LPVSEVTREQDYVTALYERVDVLRQQASAGLATALRQGSGTAQSRLERDAVRRGRPRRSIHSKIRCFCGVSVAGIVVLMRRLRPGWGRVCRAGGGKSPRS
jgi:hypothetical protein